MFLEYDALVVGAGPAGTSSAILLAKAGWRVVIVEQHAYPRRKVCGECVAAGNLELLDELGIGAAFRSAAGPEIRRVGWMGAAITVTGEMPPCSEGAYRYGRALGRDRLDTLLLDRARALGVCVRQPARVRHVRGELGSFQSTLQTESGDEHIRTAVVIDAHGSWERGPVFASAAPPTRAPHCQSDLFAFKANFRHTALEPGFLPVLALPGGYGGMVVENEGLATLACCLRRDALSACRRSLPATSAGDAVEGLLRRVCAGVGAALQSAQREGDWLSVGPLRPGIRIGEPGGAFRVGNAAGESHALIGEGISMALQSSALLAGILTRRSIDSIRGPDGVQLHRAYAASWRRTFAPRLRLAAIYAHIAMRPALAAPTRALLGWCPALLSGAARLAGKAAKSVPSPSTPVELA